MFLVAKNSHGQIVGSIEVNAEAKTIGRAQTAHLMLPSEGVSRAHATIYLHQRGIVIADEGSANGVKIDGKLIAGPTLIDERNRIQISEFFLSLQQSSSKAQALPAERDDDLDQHTILEEQGISLVGQGLELVGRGGAYDQTLIGLEKTLLMVGRDDECDIVLDDPSISRKHCQIRKNADGKILTLLDLRSSNGTFIDGQRIKRENASLDSIIRFGDLAFKLREKKSERLDGRNKHHRVNTKKKRRIWLASTSVAIVLIAAIAIGALLKKPEVVEKKKTIDDVIKAREAQVQLLIDQAKRDISRRNWTSAITSLDKALDKSPLHREAKRVREICMNELSFKKVYDEAMKYYGLGTDENIKIAKLKFHSIPKTSVYFRDVRYKLRSIDEQLAQVYRVDGLGRCKAKYYRKCYEKLCKYFETMPMTSAIRGEKNLRAKMAFVEKRLGKSKSFVLCQADRYTKRDVERTQGSTITEALAIKYKERVLQNVMTEYYEGKLDLALKMVAKIKAKRKYRPFLDKIKFIQQQLLTINGKYQEGYSFLRQEKIEGAEKSFEFVLIADSTLIPKGFMSFHRKDVNEGLAKLLFQQGKEDFKRKHYRKSFNKWQKAKRYMPSHSEALNGLLSLKKVAEEQNKKGERLKKAGEIAKARAAYELARDISSKGQQSYQIAIGALNSLK